VTHAVRGATPHEGQAGVRYREWSFGAGMNYVHDIELGADGRFYGVDMGADGVLWFTMALSNQIGRMDVASGEIRLRDLYVHLSHHKLSGEGHRIFNLPYGLDIDPVDGSVWYSKLYADRIGRVDPRTLGIEEFSTAARRPAPHALRAARGSSPGPSRCRP
jgi:virginiamycin B lyase